MKRFVLYARVSGETQEREETIESQIDHLKKLAATEGQVVLERHFYIDDGYSGDLLARPGLDRLRDDARDGLLDVILVHDPDRLARRYVYQVLVIEELEKCGCEMRFFNRPIAKTPEDRMLLGVQGLFAEYERAKIMERSRRGRKFKLQTGTLVTSQAAFGYRWIPRQGGLRGRVEIVPEQAELVRRIFGWVAHDGLTILQVSRKLMDERILAPKGGVRWGVSTLQNMLKNRAYVGEFCLNRYEVVEANTPPKPGIYRRKRKSSQRQRPEEDWIVVPGPAILDRSLFDAAQKQLARNKRFARRRVRADHEMLLRGLLRCGVCGYSISAASSEPRGKNGIIFRYYSCVRRRQPGRYGDPNTRCSLPPMKAEVLDEIVWSDVCALMTQPERIARHAGLNESGTGPLRAESSRLTKESEQLDTQLKRLLDAYQRGMLELEDLVRRRTDIDERKRRVTEKLKDVELALRDEVARRDLRAQLPHLVQGIQKGLASADQEERQRLLRLLIENIVVRQDLEVEIQYALPAGWPQPPDDEPGGGSPGRNRRKNNNLRVLSGEFEQDPKSARAVALRFPCRVVPGLGADGRVEHTRALRFARRSVSARLPRAVVPPREHRESRAWSGSGVPEARITEKRTVGRRLSDESG